MCPDKLSDPKDTDSALEAARNISARSFQSLWRIIRQYNPIGSTPQPTVSQQEPPTAYTMRSGGLLKLLSYIPYLLSAGFVLSFFWDFNGLSASLFGSTLAFEGLLKIISVSGLIGFSTNWIAIKMLFKPIRKHPLLGQGLIPAQKDRIAYRLAQTVSSDLINPEIIKQKIHESQAISAFREEASGYIRDIIDNPAFRSEIKQWVVDYVDEMIADPEIRGGLSRKILGQIEDALQTKAVERVALKAYSFIRGREMQQIVDESLTRLPISVENGLDKIDRILDRLPTTFDKHSDSIENIVTALLYRLINQLNVHNLVEENLRQYDEQKLSKIIHSATNEQLSYIQYLGAVLGAVGGFIIWEPVISTAVVSICAIIIFGLDKLLMRLN